MRICADTHIIACVLRSVKRFVSHRAVRPREARTGGWKDATTGQMARSGRPGETQSQASRKGTDVPGQQDGLSGERTKTRCRKLSWSQSFSCGSRKRLAQQYNQGNGQFLQTASLQSAYLSSYRSPIDASGYRPALCAAPPGGRPGLRASVAIPKGHPARPRNATPRDSSHWGPSP